MTKRADIIERLAMLYGAIYGCSVPGCSVCRKAGRSLLRRAPKAGLRITLSNPPKRKAKHDSKS